VCLARYAPCRRPSTHRRRAAQATAEAAEARATAETRAAAEAAEAPAAAEAQTAVALAGAARRLPLSPPAAAPSPLGGLLGPAAAPASALLYSLLQTASPRRGAGPPACAAARAGRPTLSALAGRRTSLDTPRILSPPAHSACSRRAPRPAPLSHAPAALRS